MQIKLAENFRALFYAPFYATRDLGFYEQEGIELQFSNTAAPGDAIGGLASGLIDVTWGGPMRVIKDRAEHKLTGESLVCFAEVVTRDPFFLVGRADLGHFELGDLARCRVGYVSEVTTPWLCLQQDMRDAGVMPDPLAGVRNRTMQQNMLALETDQLDVVQAFEPYVSIALQKGYGRILYAASTRGPTAYTSLIATRDGLEHKADGMRAMTRAIRSMQTWMLTHDPSELAAVVAPYFPHIDASLLDTSIRRYAKAGIWAKEPELSREGFMQLARSVHSGGFVPALCAYEDCVAAL